MSQLPFLLCRQLTCILQVFIIRGQPTKLFSKKKKKKLNIAIDRNPEIYNVGGIRQSKILKTIFYVEDLYRHFSKHLLISHTICLVTLDSYTYTIEPCSLKRPHQFNSQNSTSLIRPNRPNRVTLVFPELYPFPLRPLSLV